MPVPSQEESPVSVTKTLKPEPFADVVWSLDQALIWGHTRRSDLANRASVVVPAPQRLTWAEYPLSFEEEDERPETVLSRQFTGSELLQAIRLGEVRTLVDGQPVDPVTYHTAALAPHSTGTALTSTDTAPFETHQHSDGTLYQKRHKRRLEPSLVIEDVLRLFPGPVTERPSKPVPGRPSLRTLFRRKWKSISSPTLICRTTTATEALHRRSFHLVDARHPNIWRASYPS